ncbi:hypothetical protein BAE44_0001324 [Dichanthelium oligosanthes]|uniref:Uncharacterized protein n=1 Tax=Dichanthelium oligosanthes TaxID=888268 RepID=A0A1E5WJS5_9POAL|nr:hypothetical protein BAE44_0001324 [Dichanthelium oligosanthes]
MDAAGQLFSIDPLERQAARGHGVVTSMAAGSDVIVLGTSRGWLVRHDFSFEDVHGKSPPPFPLPLLLPLSRGVVSPPARLLPPLQQITTSGAAALGTTRCTGCSSTPAASTASPRWSTPAAPRRTTTTPGGSAPSRYPASAASSSMPSPGTANPSRKVAYPLLSIESSIGLTVVAAIVERLIFVLQYRPRR